jgi:hypothetical protein
MRSFDFAPLLLSTVQRGQGSQAFPAVVQPYVEALPSTCSVMCCTMSHSGPTRLPDITAVGCPRSADTATGVLEHAAEGLLHSSGATSAAATDDEPECEEEGEDEEAEEDGCSAGMSSVEPSRSCSVTSEDEPLLDNGQYRKIRDLNRCALGSRSGLATSRNGTGRGLRNAHDSIDLHR